jgi:ketosteroid isomerase-like protein
MSQRDVDHMRRGVEHFRRTGEALWSDMAPDCEMHDHDLPDAVIYRGHDGWRAWRDHFSEAWESVALERGQGSGVEVERREGIVWTVRDGKTVRIDYYSSADEALEAAGLREQALSQEDVELVRRLYADGGPFSLPMDPDEERALLDHLFQEYYDEQLEVHMPPDYPEGEQIFVGRRGMAELIGVLRDSWTKWRFEAERFIDAGDRVIVLIRVLAEGGSSGLATERETAHVWAVREGRLTSIQIYRDRSEAFEAAGPVSGGA